MDIFKREMQFAVCTFSVANGKLFVHRKLRFRVRVSRVSVRVKVLKIDRVSGLGLKLGLLFGLGLRLVVAAAYRPL